MIQSKAQENERARCDMVASPRFELRSGDPESLMIDPYTTRLLTRHNQSLF